MNKTLFIDPAKTLESTMRALYVIKQVGAVSRREGVRKLWASLRLEDSLFWRTSDLGSDLGSTFSCGGPMFFHPSGRSDQFLPHYPPSLPAQVLQDDGHVYLINSNPLLTPLLREAALCCVNPNLWFLTEPWAPGSLTDPTSASSPSSLAAAGKGLSRSSSSSAAAAAPLLFRPEHQPNRQLLAARSLAMVNPHCLRSGVLDRPPPRLHALDKWKLFATRRRGGRSGVAMDLLRGAVALEGKASQLLLPRMLQVGPVLLACPKGTGCPSSCPTPSQQLYTRDLPVGREIARAP